MSHLSHISAIIHYPVVCLSLIIIWTAVNDRSSHLLLHIIVALYGPVQILINGGGQHISCLLVVYRVHLSFYPSVDVLGNLNVAFNFLPCFKQTTI